MVTALTEILGCAIIGLGIVYWIPNDRGMPRSQFSRKHYISFQALIFFQKKKFSFKYPVTFWTEKPSNHKTGGRCCIFNVVYLHKDIWAYLSKSEDWSGAQTQMTLKEKSLQRFWRFWCTAGVELLGRFLLPEVVGGVWLLHATHSMCMSAHTV